MMSVSIYENILDPLLRDLRKSITEFSGMKPGDRVIDVCCGTGAQVLDYGSHGIVATGVDNSQDMLNIADKNRSRRKAINVSFQLADAANLPFSDGYFDYATVSFGLHDKENDLRLRIMSEMKRVTGKGGVLVLVDFQIPLPGNIWGAAARFIEFLAGGSHYQGFKDYLARGGLEGILKNNSLQEERRIYLLNGLVVAKKMINS